VPPLSRRAKFKCEKFTEEEPPLTRGAKCEKFTEEEPLTRGAKCEKFTEEEEPLTRGAECEKATEEEPLTRGAAFLVESQSEGNCNVRAVRPKEDSNASCGTGWSETCRPELDFLCVPLAGRVRRRSDGGSCTTVDDTGDAGDAERKLPDKAA